ncbi:hypothetical protein [Lentzea guizhouensis]|uniref:hypothetical protein n=1 Tax=Lentzea guizhouensis TaxID=1586287 RepID=UPI001F36B0CF|nr:hypothetical protein [Lentzea guizhouensis]
MTSGVARTNDATTHSFNRCSTSTPAPDSSHRANTAVSTGRTTSFQVKITPSAASESASIPCTAMESIASAARPSPRASREAPGIFSPRPPAGAAGTSPRVIEAFESSAKRAASADEAPRRRARCISSSRATSRGPYLRCRPTVWPLGPSP